MRRACVPNLVQNDIVKLLLFDSSNCRPGAKTSLKEYVDRMQTSQSHIYYAHVVKQVSVVHTAVCTVIAEQSSTESVILKPGGVAEGGAAPKVHVPK